MLNIQVSRKEKIAILLLLSLIYVSSYAIYPYRAPGGFAYPSAGPLQMVVEENWANDTRSTPGHDDILQLKTAHWIVDGKLDKNNWQIALGYPILIIPFLFTIHAFLIPDLLLFLGSCYCTFMLSVHFSGSKKIGYISLAALFFLTGFLLYFLNPEKQHVNEFGFMIIAYWLFQGSANIGKIKTIVIGLILGWVFWSGTVDLLYFIPMMAIFLIYKPRKKIIWLFPSILLVIGLFALQYDVFGNPLVFGNAYQDYILNYTEKNTTPIMQNLEGVKTMTFDPHIILKRAYCMLFDPNACKPISYGIQAVDEYNESLLPGKRAILVGSTFFFVFAPYGFMRVLLRYSGYEKSVLLLILISFIMGISFWVSIFMWHAGGSPFWRYDMVWYPLLTTFALIGISDILKRCNFIKA